MSFVWRKRCFLLLFPFLLAASVWLVHVESDLNAFFTATDNADSRLLSGLLKSGDLSRRYLLVVEKTSATLPGAQNPDIGDSRPSTAMMDDLSAKLVAQLAQVPEVEKVWPANAPPRIWLEALNTYAPYHARLFSLNPAQDAGLLFEPHSLESRAETLKQVLLSPQGGFVKTIAKQDPLLLSLNGFKGMQEQFQRQAQIHHDSGALILQSRPAALDSDAQMRLQAAIHASFDEINQSSGGGYRLSMAGVPVFSLAAQTAISQDVTLVSVVSSVAVILVFLLLFRSFAALHWIMLLQAASFILGTLATAVIFGHVHSLTLALGASLIGICTDYPIHVMVHCAKHRHTPLAAVRLLWPSLALGGVTTIIGYAAMGMTGFPGFEQIAVFALFSISAALALTRWVLPALLGNTRLHSVHLPGIVSWVNFCARYRKALLGVFAICVVLALFSLPQLRWMADMQNLTMDMQAIKQQDESVRAHFSSIEPGRFVLVQADDLETALQRAEAVERRLLSLKQAGVISEYHGLFPWLVSQVLQAENANAYTQALNPEFQLAWRAALLKADLSVDKLGYLPPAKTESLQPEIVLTSPVRDILSGQIIEAQTGVALALWLGEHDPAKLAAALTGLEGARYFSQKDQLDQLAIHYRDKSLLMLAIGIALMSVFILWQQRNIRTVLLTLLPTLASVLFIFAIWAWIGEEVSFLHVIGLLLAVSLCVDYGIFFMDNRGENTDVTYHGIAASTLTTLASFGALGLGKTPTLPILALSVSLGVTLGFLLCPLFIYKPSR